MNKILVATTLIMTVVLSACDSYENSRADQILPLQVSLADPSWSGFTIPEGQQCRKFGGNGATPRLLVSGIPEGANAVIVAFSDRSWFLMNHGGHGMIGLWTGYAHNRVEIPSVAGETFDLPSGIFIEQPHRGGRGEPGAYLPPCSGGRGNRYVAEVMAVHKGTGDEPTWLLAEGEISMGRY